MSEDSGWPSAEARARVDREMADVTLKEDPNCPGRFVVQFPGDGGRLRIGRIVGGDYYKPLIDWSEDMSQKATHSNFVQVGEAVTPPYIITYPPTAAEVLRQLREEIAGMKGEYESPDGVYGCYGPGDGTYLVRADVLAAIDRKIAELGQ